MFITYLCHLGRHPLRTNYIRRNIPEEAARTNASVLLSELAKMDLSRDQSATQQGKKKWIQLKFK